MWMNRKKLWHQLLDGLSLAMFYSYLLKGDVNSTEYLPLSIVAKRCKACQDWYIGKYLTTDWNYIKATIANFLLHILCILKHFADKLDRQMWKCVISRGFQSTSSYCTLEQYYIFVRKVLEIHKINMYDKFST